MLPPPNTLETLLCRLLFNKNMSSNAAFVVASLPLSFTIIPAPCLTS